MRLALSCGCGPLATSSSDLRLVDVPVTAGWPESRGHLLLLAALFRLWSLAPGAIDSASSGVRWRSRIRYSRTRASDRRVPRRLSRRAPDVLQLLPRGQSVYGVRLSPQGHAGCGTQILPHRS